MKKRYTMIGLALALAGYVATSTAESSFPQRPMQRPGAGSPQTLDPQVLRLKGQFNTLDPEPLVNAYEGLSPAQQSQLVGVLNNTQLTQLYVAIGSVSGPAAAQSFLTLLTEAQASAVVAAAGAAGTAGAAGMTIGGVTLTAAQVGALVAVTAVAVVGGVAVSNNNNDDNNNRLFTAPAPSTVAPAAPVLSEDRPASP